MFARLRRTQPTLPHFGQPARALTLVRNARARQMKLSVDPRDGAIRLVLPPRMALGQALKWVETKRDWVEVQLGRVMPAASIAPGESIPYRGRPLLIDWSAERPRTPRHDGDRLILGGPAETVESRVKRWLRAQAKQLLDAETRDIATRAGVTIAAVGVGDTRSRWGSCSSNGDIRYSWRLILAPDFVRIATVTHEVAHRVHMDHSPAFHALVARLLGTDAKPARTWLRQHGSSLHRVGARDAKAHGESAQGGVGRGS